MKEFLHPIKLANITSRASPFLVTPTLVTFASLFRRMQVLLGRRETKSYLVSESVSECMCERVIEWQSTQTSV